MTVFLIAVATVAPSPGFEMLTCDEPLKARKPKIRMNPPRAASYKKNGNQNQIFTSTGYFLFMNSNRVHRATDISESRYRSLNQIHFFLQTTGCFLDIQIDDSPVQSVL